MEIIKTKTICDVCGAETSDVVNLIYAMKN